MNPKTRIDRQLGLFGFGSGPGFGFKMPTPGYFYGLDTCILSIYRSWLF
jgi:hypothetical protein